MITRRILLVDSQRNWLEFAERVLTDAGFEVEPLPGIKEARHLLSTDGDDFALILVDLESVEEDTATFREITRTESGRKRPIVVLFPTALTPVDMSEIFRLGAYDCVNKRYGRQGLLNLVTEQLADYQGILEESPPSSQCEKKTTFRDFLDGIGARARRLHGFTRLAKAVNIG